MRAKSAKHKQTSKPGFLGPGSLALQAVDCIFLIALAEWKTHGC